ncbi:MAG TPA: DUF4097 family beta strand repeat-containing protein [Gemmatimonadales bacterium]|nr:DUF4097 family beta strand repeat-containing protein [Gemmatimonadales bacterium]
MLLLLAALATLPMQGTDTTVPVPPRARLSLGNFQGTVTITSWNRSALRVEATHDDDTHIDINVGGGVVQVRGRSRYGPPEVDYRLTVPAEMSLEISSHSGDVKIQGSRGEVQVQTNEGAITVDGGRGRISLQSVEGDVSLADADGRINIGTVDGGVTVRGARGDLSVNAVDGAITLEDIDASSVDASSVDGAISFTGALHDHGRYRLSSHDGNVTVVTPAVNAAVTVSTFDGDFESDFPITLNGISDRKRLNFTLGNGGARLELESFDGTVSLRKPGGRTGDR